ncbi:hypothetical protein I3842_03G059200 [Carya illinoinensis]|uniref:Secreted protein n=1 Tax=Carya illinoinensis TaxID=32201 RepID=A0A922FGZ6_CARIL|nr:hypothetical protein I3842_03G059200 [Carya illinoinensis]
MNRILQAFLCLVLLKVKHLNSSFFPSTFISCDLILSFKNVYNFLPQISSETSDFLRLDNTSKATIPLRVSQ